MNPVPNIIVLDFCEWLNQKFELYDDDRPSIMDLLVGNGNNRFRLEDYAHEYLEETKATDCPYDKMIISFLCSEEYHETIQNCHKKCWRSDKCCDRTLDLCERICCPEIHRSFHQFAKHYELHGLTRIYRDISASHLADYTRYMLLHGDLNKGIFKQSALLALIMDSSVELSEELNFFNWLEHTIDRPTDVRKMPTEIFEKLVDEYVKENHRTGRARTQLLKSYRRTGWEELLERFQILVRIKKRRSKSLSEIMERYYSHCGRYKCIILPLSDEVSQRAYRALISESWNDLNSCSGDLLDIYYSELDTGKSGFDIAKRINMLPESLHYKTPCIIIWEHSMKDAEALRITDLDNRQIVRLVGSIVESIKSDVSFKRIIKEAQIKVTELQNEKKPISNYYAPIIYGNKNVVGDNNAVGTGNIHGSSNTIEGNSIHINDPEAVSNAYEGFRAALSAIHSSEELNDAMKAQLSEIIETAKTGVADKSIEKQEQAKSAFGYVKSFLIKVAPKLFEVLSSIATIATFFGIKP